MGEQQRVKASRRVKDAASSATKLSPSMNPKDAMSKEQKSVAHWLRKNVPTKKTKFLSSHVVEYFIASKAIDALMKDSPWAKGESDSALDPDPGKLVFTSRPQCIEYLDELLRHKMFHRARKIPVVSPKEDKDKEKDKDKDKDKDKAKDGEKKKRKIRLDMHLEQIFVDSSDAYVWLYDPLSWHYWAGGTAIVLGTIAVCLFPLWPAPMRTGIHYLCVGAAGFLVLILGIAAIKYLLFAVLFLITAGNLSFWLFPNLTEDVGFFESFWPLVEFTYTGKPLLRRRRAKKAKESDDEDDGDESAGQGEDAANAQDNNSETDESVSKKSSSVGRDFEMVEKSGGKDPDKEDTSAED